MPEDECSPTGGRVHTVGPIEVGKDDECDTGLPEHDVCDNSIAGADQCPAMNETTDACNPDQSPIFDRCYSGLPVDDACNPDGGKATDDCPGGGASRDTCMAAPHIWTKGAGDECSDENGSWLTKDSCRPPTEGSEDNCGFFGAADVCYEGTNETLSNVGGADICRGVEVGGIRPYGDGSDTCLDGSAAQDNCGGWNHNQGGKEPDVCLPTQQGEKDDLCDNTPQYEGVDVGSDDYCFNGLPTSDECKPALKDEDECPAGLMAADECASGLSAEDDCPGGMPAVDVCIPSVPDSDECVETLTGSDESCDSCSSVLHDAAE